MAETWEQTKERLRKQGIGTLPVEEKPEPPKPRYDEQRAEPIEPRFNLRRVILPGGQTDYLVFNATLPDIKWWVEHKTRFKLQQFESPIEGIEAIAFYEPVPVNATDAERSIYYNKKPVITDESIH